MKYTMVIEKGPTSYGAYARDLPGCIAAAESRDEVRKLISVAVELYVEVMKKDGLPMPEPQHSGVAELRAEYGWNVEMETVEVVVP